MKMTLGLIDEEKAPVPRTTSHPLVRRCSRQHLADLSAWEVAPFVVGSAERPDGLVQPLVQGVALGVLTLGRDIARIYVSELSFGLKCLAGAPPDDRLDDAHLLEGVEQSELYPKSVPVCGSLDWKLRRGHALRVAAQPYLKRGILKPLVEGSELDLEHVVA